MNGQNFRDNLRNENVANDKAKVVPALGEDKKRLEVAKIEKIIIEETDGDFEKFANDEDVYNALQSLSVQDLRLVFKACADSLKIDCDSEALNKLVKSRVIALFFSVFGVYPEANPTTENSADNFGDAKIISEYLDSVFPNFGGAVEVDFSKVAGFLPNRLKNLHSLEELKISLSAEKLPEGKIVRDFVENAVKISGISCDVQELTSLRREFYLPLFFHAIKIVNFSANKKIDEVKNISADTEIIDNVTFSQLQAVYNAAQKIPALDLDFDIAQELKIFEDNSGGEKIKPVTVKDNFYLSIPDDKEILRGIVGISTLDGKIIAIGHIEDGKIIERGIEKILPHLVFSAKNIRTEDFQSKKRFLALIFPISAKEFFAQPMSQTRAENYNGEIFTLEFNIAYSALAITENPLCIDFGTSNTTAGTFDLNKKNSIELVTFRDVTNSEIVEREVLPTVVYVDSCRDGIINFKHGYEAQKEIISAGYDTRATVFYEIKRWINSLDKIEEITDSAGNSATITRREILKDYLLYVIRAAEQQYKMKFKNLHMTSPIKLRQKFLSEIKKILPNYKIIESSLDEGVAIVYHYIAKQIESGGDNSGKILILDCGGGTTDLASCKFSIKQGEDWPLLEIETDFENGDSNFGGNNITYRILQMLKMKIAKIILDAENLDMHELVKEDDEEILSQIDFDDENKNKIYAEFEKKYFEAENLIPTKFAEYTLSNEARKAKRNFYYLWQIAEAVKIEFFKSNLVNVDFEKDKKIYVKDFNEYYLSVRKNGKLQKFENPMDGVEITIREIGHIILPDIYALLKNLLEDYTDLQSYQFRLSGQSCKINQFRDLFKEFVPGKLMRIAKDRNKSNILRNADSVILKKYCIFGSIEYVRDAKTLGKYKPTISYKPNRRIYDVKITVGNDETILLNRKGEIKIKKFPRDTSAAEFLVCSKKNHIERKFVYNFDKSKKDKCYENLDDVIELFANESLHSKRELRDTIGEILNNITLPEYGGKTQGIFCIFALESKSGYGFNICQVFVEASNNGDGKKFWIPPQRPFEAFEDENLQTFFNGDK